MVCWLPFMLRFVVLGVLVVGDLVIVCWDLFGLRGGWVALFLVYV